MTAHTTTTASGQTRTLPATALLAGLALLVMLLLPVPAHAALLDPSDSGFDGRTRGANYDELLDAMYASGNVTTTIGDKLWVPWFGSSSSCTQADLKAGSSCNSGEAIDFTHNCMVTDEFSQVGVLVAMGDDQARMDQFFNTVNAINSSFGRIPAWRVYRSGDRIEQCRPNINGNCDTASDATARIIIALYTAGNNSRFSGAQRARYHELASNLSAAMLQYETVQSCKPSSLGRGDICYWLAAGSQARAGGMGSTDFGYTGYYPDAIIAMLLACSHTRNTTYCAAAGNFTLNYLEAAKWDGTRFSAPPGRSFKWTNLAGVPVAQCTNTCNPDAWDGADAPRALGMCQAQYYAQRVNVTLPGLGQYCDQWGDRYMRDPSRAPYQYYSNGTNSASYQSGYFAQGLQALLVSGYDPSLFEPALDNALTHYTTSKRTWDWTACFGVYHQTFPMRALGMGIGLDEESFTPLRAAVPQITPNATPSVNATQPSNTTNATTPPLLNSTTPGANTTNGTNTTNATVPVLQNIAFSTIAPAGPVTINEPSNYTFIYVLSNPSNLTTSSTWRLNDRIVATNTTSYRFRGNMSSAGTWNITVQVVSTKNTLTNTFTLIVRDVPNTSQPSNTTSPTNTTIPANGTAQNTSANTTAGNATTPSAPTNSTTSNTTNVTITVKPQSSSRGGMAKELRKADPSGAVVGDAPIETIPEAPAAGLSGADEGAADEAPAVVTTEEAIADTSAELGIGASPPDTDASFWTTQDMTSRSALIESPSALRDKLYLLLTMAVLAMAVGLVFVIETSSRHGARRRFGYHTINLVRHTFTRAHEHASHAEHLAVRPPLHPSVAELSRISFVKR